MSFSQELIDQYAPGARCIEAMKVWKLPEGKEKMFPEVANSGDYFAELKKDGYWYQYEKTEIGTTYLFSRTKSKTTGILTEKGANVPHIMEALSKVPNGTTIIGEIYYPNKESKDVTRIMGCLPEKAIERQNNEGLIHYYIHDIIQYNGEDLVQKGALARYSILKKLYQEIELYHYDFIELADIYTENIQEETAAALDRGEEGMVLKKNDAPYSPGKRPAWANLKIKKVDYLDAICIGFCDATKEYTGKDIDNWEYNICISDNSRLQGNYKNLCDIHGNSNIMAVTKGYYLNWKTAIKIGAYDKENNIKEIGTVASGLTDELREDFSIHPEKYLNRVVMLQCMECDKESKTLRHAFFKGFRDDKNPEDCLMENIFDN